MKRFHWRNKKGQIQGVDFALSMIVFMIVFAEVIVLSLSYIEPKYINLEDRAFETRADQISDAFFASAGYPIDWEYNYGIDFNSFGLLKYGTSELDANKISRINPKSLYHLSYESIRGNLSREKDFGFQLTIESLFDVECNLTLVQPIGTVDVTTSVSDCDIWIFVVAPDMTVMFTNRTQTDTSGVYSTTFPIGFGPLPDGYFTLVVFAKNSEGQYAVDYTELIVNDPTDMALRMIVQENENNNGLATIQATNNDTLSSFTATVLFPYQNGEEIYGNETQIINAPTNLETFNLRIPTNGTCVALVNGYTAGGGYDREVFVYPTTLTSDSGTVAGSLFVPEREEVLKIEKIVVIRECIFKAVLFIWPD
ncbi:MAG: hypothetical protein ACTSO7_08440 [Candidatus Heimdallarchaeota archaeon]